MFELASLPQQPRKLARRVLQINALLDVCQAELARVPGGHCGDIGLLASGQQNLQPATAGWAHAKNFVCCFKLQFDRMQGDGVAMRHWLRVEAAAPGGIPHRMRVDEDRMCEMLGYLRRSGA